MRVSACIILIEDSGLVYKLAYDTVKKKRKSHNRLGGAIEGTKPRILFMLELKMHAPGVQTR